VSVADLSVHLDRSSPVPLYHQVARQVEAAIERGDLSPGARLENEIRMAERWGLSRPTMRRAIQELVDKGLLVRKRGIGTQVVNRQVKRPVRLTSLYDDLASTGQEPSTRVLLHEVVPATPLVAEHLGVPIEADVVRLQRVRSARAEPLALLNNWLPTEVASEFTTDQLQTGGLYELFRAQGVNLRIASQRIGARAASATEAGLLHIRKGDPLLRTERTTYDDYGRAVEYANHVYRADTYSMEVTVVGR
jgi:DNA-binding GntR family transcriptional regulator